MFSQDQFDGQAEHEKWMRYALREARQAIEEDEVPVGAVIVAAGRIIASAHNQKEQLADPTAHAEMIALTQASSALGTWRLIDCIL
ncbi:MAG: nucleoside deaminase, partial [Planctomycetaceae bacterium]|nr:nucleoside deaminase [Planctomycetaceae bacterium]